MKASHAHPPTKTIAIFLLPSCALYCCTARTALLCCRPIKTNMLLEKSGASSGEFEVLKRREHLALESLVMKVQDLGTKRRVSAHSDADMAPLLVQDVEVIMIDQRPILGPAN